MAIDIRAELSTIERLVQLSGHLLDRQDFRGWLELFDEESSYEVTAYSAEIRQHMAWWRSDRSELAKMLEEVPRHVSDPSRRLHIISPPVLELSGEEAAGTANFAVFRSGLDGETSLYVVGHYEDRFVKKGDGWRYSSRRAVLQTRMLDIPTHVPI